MTKTSRTVRFDINEDNVPITNVTTRSDQTTFSTHTDSSRSHFVPPSSWSPSRCETRENARPKVVATADFRGTNPIIDEEVQEEEVPRIPTLDDRGHINFTSSRYKKAVDTAKHSARARGALFARSARSRDPYNPNSPTRSNRTNQSLDIQENSEEDEDESRHDECQRRPQEQDVAHLQNSGRAGSRKQSTSASWTYCGYSCSNTFLRLCTSVVFVPFIVCGLIFWPVLAAAALTSILLCVCCYEHAWLSFRIHSQLLATYQWYEGNEGPADAGDAIGTSTRSDASLVHGYQEGEMHFKNSFVSSGFTGSSASFPTGPTALGLDNGNISVLTSNDKDSFDDPISEVEAAMRSRVPSAIHLLELETSSDILLGLANFLFRGNLWVARVVVAALLTVCWSFAATMAFPLIPFPVASTPSDISSAPCYFWVVNFVASLCAVSCPTWPSAVSLVVQKSAFEVILLNTLNCPLAASVDCSAAPITSLQTFALGAMALILVHSLSGRGPANLVVGVILDLLGYAYIAGALGLLITMVDASDHKSTWATIWLGMLSATWTAQFAGYVCDTIMSHFQLPHMQLSPPRIIVTLNVEASICAIAAASVVLIFGGAILDVPGGVLPKVLFSIGSVVMACFGRLVMSLLKTAAGVRRSGRLMPGFGGALDGAHVVLFTSIVFVKYYLYVIAQQTSEMDDQSGSGDSAPWLLSHLTPT